MLICIPDILGSAQLREIRAALDTAAFADGRETAGWAAAGVKRNQQLPAGTAIYRKLQKTVAEALRANRIFALAAMPKAMRPLLFSRYLPGMAYGQHVDNAMMGEDPPMRADLALTLFLSGPEDYGGGELVIDEPAGTRSFKLPAGALVLYPANSLHQVTEVTKGCRDVAVGWLQSMVRSHDQRRVLFELETLRAEMFARTGKGQEFDTLSRNTSDLWRMWADV